MLLTARSWVEMTTRFANFVQLTQHRKSLLFACGGEIYIRRENISLYVHFKVLLYAN